MTPPDLLTFIGRRITASAALLAISLVLLTGLPIATTQANDFPVNAYVTRGDDQSLPKTEAMRDFGCEDKVFAVIEAQNAPEKAHTVVVRWIDPAGKERERTQTSLHGFDGTSRIWSWLKLHRGAGATLLSIFDPAAGLEGFIGTWEVYVSIERRELPVIEFDVLC